MASAGFPTSPQVGDSGHTSVAHSKMGTLLNHFDYDAIVTTGLTSGQLLRVDATTGLLAPVAPTPDMVGADPVGAAATAQANAQAYTDEQIAGIAGIGTEFHAYESLSVPGYVPSTAATSGAVTVDLSVSVNWHISVDAATTISFVGMDPSQVSRVHLRLRYLGAYGVTFDPSLTVVGVPALSNAAGKIDLLTLSSWPNTGASSGVWYYEPGAIGLTAPGVTAPATPAAPTLATVSGSTSVTVSWSAPDNGGAAITGYAWQVCDASTNAVLKSGTTTTRTVTATGLTAGASVYAQVNATNSAGTSPWSPASITLTVGASNAARDPNTGFPTPLGVGCAIGGIWPPRSELGQNSYEDGYKGEETYLGRSIEFARQYATTIDKEHFNVGGTGWDYATIGKNRTLCVSYRGWLTNPDGSNTTYPWYTTDGSPSIATGCVDAQIKARAKAAGTYMVSSGRPLHVVFHHEPDGKTNAGTPADFCKAFTHFANQFLQGARTAPGWSSAVEARLHFGIIPLVTSFPGTPGYSGKNGPGYFDSAATDPMDATATMGRLCSWIGVDGYNWYGTGSTVGAKSHEFADIFFPKDASGNFTGWYGWATTGDRAGRPLVICEFSSQDPAGASESFATWIDSAVKALPSAPMIAAIMVWSSEQTAGNTFDVRDTPAKHAGWKAAVADNYPYVNPNLAPPPAGSTPAALQSASSLAVFSGGSTGKSIVKIPATYAAGNLITGCVVYGNKAATLTLPTGFTAIGSPVAVGPDMLMQPIWKVATSDESANAGDSTSPNYYPFITKDSTGAVVSVLFTCALKVWAGAKTSTAPSVYTSVVTQGQALAIPAGVPSLNAGDVLDLSIGGEVNNWIAKTTAAGSGTSMVLDSTFLAAMSKPVVDVVTISSTATPKATGITVNSFNTSTKTAALSTSTSWASGDALVLSRPAGSTNNAGEVGTPFAWPSPAVKVPDAEASNVTKYPTKSGAISGATFTANAAGVPSWSGSALPNGPLPGDYGIAVFRVVPA